MRFENIIDIKIKNTFKIIDAIRFHDDYTKKDIVTDSGLSFATVSNICRELKENGILSEARTDDTETSVGRSPMLVRLNYPDFLGACFDLHRWDKMSLSITNLRNEIVCQKAMKPKEYATLRDFVLDCRRVCEQACGEMGTQVSQLLGVCAAVPAIYDHKTGLTVGSGIALFEGQPLKETMEEIFNLPVFVDNESNISSMSVMLNNSRSIENLIYILCSDGLGVGIITHGKPLSGNSGYAPEICHIPIGNERLTCKLCGNKGCVESDLSLSGFITKHLNYAQWDTEKTAYYWDAFLTAVEAGEASAIQAVEENAVILGKLVSILVNLFDPEIVCFGGDASVLFDRMKQTVENEVAKRHNVQDASRTIFIRDNDENTILYGCSEIIYSRINFTTLHKR